MNLGGAISAEHGISFAKSKHLKTELEAHGGGYMLEIMKGIKKIFDPKGIMNPGKLHLI